MPKDVISPEKRDRMGRGRRLLASGMTYAQTAKILGVSEKTIYRDMKVDLPPEEYYDSPEAILAQELYRRALEGHDIKRQTAAAKLFEVALKIQALGEVEESHEVSKARENYQEALAASDVKKALGAAGVYLQALQLQNRVRAMHPEIEREISPKVRFWTQCKDGRSYDMESGEAYNPDRFEINIVFTCYDRSVLPDPPGRRHD